MVSAGDCTFAFDMSVERIHEAPRVTKPFSDETWSNLVALGDAVESDLVAQDVRLTMGGEPTFVSVDDFESAEWNTSRSRTDQARNCRRLCPPASPSLRAQRLSALWAGQMVSRRKSSALGLRCLLAQGRGVDLDRSLSGRKEDGPRNASIEHAERITVNIADRIGIDPEFAVRRSKIRCTGC